MSCFTCGSKEGPFHKLEYARQRFIRKRHPNFGPNSALCSRCNKQFEKIYQMKSKSKRKAQNLSNSSMISSVSSSTKSDKSAVTTIQRSEGNNNENEPDSRSADLALQFDSRSMDSSVDSTDRIVQMVPEFLSLRDSTRKTRRNPELNVARQGAEAALQSAKRRQLTSIHEESTQSTQAKDTSIQRPRNRSTTLDETIPEDRPVVTPKRKRLEIVDDDTSDDEDLASSLSPNNLAHVRPIVRRRREPVVQHFNDIMDLYIARTSGG